MIAAILCPGPSLTRYDGSGDIRIGVNRAAIAYQCDHWCAIDYHMVKDKWPQVKGKPQLWTDRQQVQKFGGNYFRTIDTDCPANWGTFSMTVAIVLAAHLGATQIDVWGCDWAGTLDYDGAPEGSMRTDDRWARERKLYAEIETWLTGKGITITRR